MHHDELVSWKQPPLPRGACIDRAVGPAYHARDALQRLMISSNDCSHSLRANPCLCVTQCCFHGFTQTPCHGSHITDPWHNSSGGQFCLVASCRNGTQHLCIAPTALALHMHMHLSQCHAQLLWDAFVESAAQGDGMHPARRSCLSVRVGCSLVRGTAAAPLPPPEPEPAAARPPGGSCSLFLLLAGA